MTAGFPRIAVVTAQNLASANTIRPLVERLGSKLAGVIILDNFPLSSWRELKAFVRLVRRCGLSFLMFKFVEIWVHYALSLLRGESVTQMCRAHGVPYLSFGSTRSEGFYRALADMKLDYVISAGPAILTHRIIALPKVAILNCHGAALPAYRGPANYIWTLLEGESMRSVTIHRMETAIDSGAIWSERTFPIDKAWSVYQYNFNHTLDAGHFLLDTVRRIVAEGPLPEAPQNEGLAVARTFPTGSDMRRLRRMGIRLMYLLDPLRCVGNAPIQNRR